MLSKTETALVGLRVCTALSFIGSVAIIVSFLFVKKLQSTMNKIVFFMSIADLGISITLFFGNWGLIYNWDVGFCKAQGFFIYLCFISTMAWAGCMATHCLLAVLITKPLRTFDRAIKYYNIIAWGIPLFIATIPFMLEKTLKRGAGFGPGSFYCSLSQNYSDWKLLLFYLPVWLVFTYNLLVYSFVGWKIMKSSKASVLASNGVGQNKQKIIASRNLRRYVIKTGIYLSVYVFCWIFPTVNRVYDFLGVDTPFPIIFLSVVTAPSQGFLNALIYFYFAFYSISSKRTSLMTATGKTDSESTHSMGPWTPTVSWTLRAAPVNMQQNHLEPNW